MARKSTKQDKQTKKAIEKAVAKAVNQALPQKLLKKVVGKAVEKAVAEFVKIDIKSRKSGAILVERRRENAAIVKERAHTGQVKKAAKGKSSFVGRDEPGPGPGH